MLQGGDGEAEGWILGRPWNGEMPLKGGLRPGKPEDLFFFAMSFQHPLLMELRDFFSGEETMPREGQRLVQGHEAGHHQCFAKDLSGQAPEEKGKGCGGMADPVGAAGRRGQEWPAAEHGWGCGGRQVRGWHGRW